MGFDVPQLTESQNDKEVTVNSALARVEGAVSSAVDVAMADANVDLSASAAAELVAFSNLFFRMTGALTAQRSLLLPDPSESADGKLYVVSNATTGGFGVSVQRAAGGAAVVVSPGTTRFLYNTGTDVIDVVALAVSIAAANVTYDPGSPAGLGGALNVQAALDFIATALGGGGGVVTSVNGDVGPAVVLAASEVPYDDTLSGLAADDVQEAIDQLASDATALEATVAALAALVAALDAADIDFDPGSPPILGGALNVQDALEAAAALGGGVTSVNGDTGPAVMLVAGEVPFDPGSPPILGGALNVQDALEAAALGAGGTVTSVNGDPGPTVLLNASEIPFDPGSPAILGGATNLQDALENAALLVEGGGGGGSSFHPFLFMGA